MSNINKNGIFITATGTDVGKTFISSLLVKFLKENDINTGYYKPALSGALNINGNIIAGDADFVCKNSNLNVDPNSLVSYIYETPVSPHLASKLEFNSINTSKILKDFKTHQNIYDYLIVEGSGGIICPIKLDDEVIMLTDIIKLLNLDIIIVASSSLGTINNTILTALYAKSQNINIKGIILNKYDESNYLHRDNKSSIERLTEIPIITCVELNAKEINIDIDLFSLQ